MLIKVKEDEESKVEEEVFDKHTLLTIRYLMRKGVIRTMGGVVSAGKESRVYWAENPDGEELALKIFLTSSSEFRKGMLPYIEGDRRFRKIKKTTRSLIYAWALKEFRNLKLAHESGVSVPKPIAVKNNVLVMSFIGKNRIPAPLVKDIELKDPNGLYEELLRQIKRLYEEAELVHADLSEYNVMLWEGKPIIIDMSQSVLKDHPRADEFLKRDLRNLNHYFSKLGVEVQSAEEVYATLKGKCLAFKSESLLRE